MSVRHVAFFGGAVWGHARPALQFSITLCIKSPNLVISLLLPANLAAVANSPLEQFLSLEAPDVNVAKDVRARIKIVAITPPEGYECPAELAQSIARPFKDSSVAFVAYWSRIHAEPQDLPRPSMLIVDIFTDYEREQIKAINDVPILFWWSSNLNYFVFHFAPEGTGGLGPSFLKALDTISDIGELERAQAEVSAMQAAEDQEVSLRIATLRQQLWSPTSDEIARVGDAPPLYQYEHACACGPVLPGAGFLMRTSTSSVFKKVDGHIICSGPWLEPKALEILKAQFETTLKKPIYCANLQISTEKGSPNFPPERLALLSPPEQGIVGFLDDALVKYGPESVLYLSWGTNFAPFATPWQADVFIDTMVENKRPFVMSQATIAAIISPGLEDRIWRATQAGLCATASWIPQEAVLKHKALGAFVTHGGWNSTCEAIGAAAPMIFWPFAIDQPVIASSLSEGPEPIAWQLYETRGPSVTEFRPYFFKDGPKTSASGEHIPIPTGTPRALKAEFERVLIREAAPGSSELKERKERMVALRQRFIDSKQAGGECDQSISAMLTSIGCRMRT
ncbi:hypothetical protein CF327_g4006 [Tilletia walkeri]|nr:hypothetical protein CF327_g4006 [Tilletia walkeri]